MGLLLIAAVLSVAGSTEAYLGTSQCGLATTDSQAICVAVRCGRDPGEDVGIVCTPRTGWSGYCATACKWDA